MKSEVKEISATQREIHIEIDPESLKTAYGLVSQKYAKKVSIPGFRKGFAPLDVVRLRYKDEIKGEVLQQVVPLKVSEAIQEHAGQQLWPSRPKGALPSYQNIDQRDDLDGSLRSDPKTLYDVIDEKCLEILDYIYTIFSI